MKKSIYNIVQKINETYYVIFNSYGGVIKLLTLEQYAEYETGKKLNCFPYYVEDDLDEMKIVQQERDAYINATKDYIRFTILPTLKCNANCSFCFENTYGRKTMSENDIEQTVFYIKSKAIQYKKLRIHWFGGEPMVALPIIYRITEQLYEFCKSNRISYKACIGTNLSLINDNNYKNLIDDLHIDTIEFAFDGIEKQHNNVKSYNNSSFDAFSHNLHMLDVLLNSNVTVVVRFNSNKSNYDDLLMLSDILCARYKDYQNFNPYLAVIVPTDLYKDTHNLILPQEYAFYYLPFFHVLQKNGAGMEVYPLHRNANFCYGTNPNSIVIGSDGVLTKCIASPSAESQSIGTIWSGVKKNNIYKKWIFDHLINECRQCPIFPLCLGGCTNDYLFKSISPCKKEKFYLQELLIDAGRYMIEHSIDEFLFSK